MLGDNNVIISTPYPYREANTVIGVEIHQRLIPDVEFVGLFGRDRGDRRFV